MALSDVLMQMTALGEGLRAHGALKIAPSQMDVGDMLGKVPPAGEHAAASLANMTALLSVACRGVLSQGLRRGILRWALRACIHRLDTVHIG
jgi:hypothetical protein